MSGMDITFKTRKLQKIFTDEKLLLKSYGKRMRDSILARIAVLQAAENLSMVPTNPPERRHQLAGKRKEQFALDLVHPHRLIFIANHHPIPGKPDGGIDVEQIKEVRILEVNNYH